MIAKRASLEQRARGFHFDLHHRTDARDVYWDEEICWSFSHGEINRCLLPSAAELYTLLMRYVDRVCADSSLLAWAGVPEVWWDRLRLSRESFRHTQLIRLDLAYGGEGAPRLLECEAEAVGGIFETGFFQLQWFEEMRLAGELSSRASQWNRLHDALVESFAEVLVPSQAIYVAAESCDSEDWLQAHYLSACAYQSGADARIVDCDEIEVRQDGNLFDSHGRRIMQLLMLRRWHHLFAEASSRFLFPALDQGMRLLTPSWTYLLSSKTCLAGLWQMFPNHPLLLPSILDREGSLRPRPGQIRKPIHGHRGEAIEMCLADGTRVSTTSGGERQAKDNQGMAAVIQAVAPSCLASIGNPAENDGCRILSIWIVAGKPVALGMRESTDPVLTGSNCRFVPHLVLP